MNCLDLIFFEILTFGMRTDVMLHGVWIIRFFS